MARLYKPKIVLTTDDILMASLPLALPSLLKNLFQGPPPCSLPRIAQPSLVMPGA
jgi:hypothetical protein